MPRLSWTPAEQMTHKITSEVTTGCLNPRQRMIRKLISLLICFVLMLIQLGFLNFYFIKYTAEPRWYCWILADLLVVGVMLYLIIHAILYNYRCLNGACASEANLQYAFVGWLVYSCVVSAKILTAVYVYAGLITISHEFGLQAYRLTLSASAVIFLMLVLSHHYHKLNSPRQTYISYLASAVTLDILDSILFLDLLYNPKLTGFITGGLRAAVVIFACVNFVLPTFGLLKLRYGTSLPHLAFLPYEKLYNMLYFMLVNIPYLGNNWLLIISLFTNAKCPILVIRIYLVQYVEDFNVNIFITKNVIGTVVGIRELWMSYLLYKESQLTATTS